MATPAVAKEKSLGSFGAWRAYSTDEGGQTVCYMVTAKLFKSTALKRGMPYLMITHRPTEASTDVVSYGAGATLDERRGVFLQVAKKKFELFSVRDIAWARDSLTDRKIAAVLRASPSAHLSGYVPVKHGMKAVNDVFDLKGADAAYTAIGKACGLMPALAPKKHVAVKKTAPKTVKKH